jgi:cytochrome c551/c552
MLDNLFLPPAAEHLPLAGPLMALLLLFHLPWLGTVLVTSGLSLAFRKQDAPLSARLMDLAVSNPAAWWVFGILPPMGLLLLSGQFFHGAPVFMPAYYANILVLMFPAYLLLFLYRRTRDIRLGGPGHLLLLASCWFLISTLDLGFFPERFFFESSLLPLLFSIQQAVHFLLFSALAALFTGAAILFFYFRWSESRLSGDESELKPLRTLGGGLALGGALAVPAALLGELYNLPLPAASAGAFLTALVMTVLAWPAAQLSFYMVKNGHTRFAPCVFASGILLFGLFGFHMVRLQSRAGAEHLAALAQNADAERQKETSAREALMAKNMVPDVKLGETIFTQKCSACHAFDHKVVGPAYNDVVPKYAADPGALTAFIRNPVKKNPAFPAMPGQGLTELEVQSVARFLLDRAGKK